MDDKTKDLIMRALKEGVTDFPLSFFRKRGVEVEFVGYNQGTEIYYIPELDILFRRT
jgi:hypothetical protein